MTENYLAGFDAVDIGNIPADARWVAGYIDGEWPTFYQLKKRWPKARRVSIAVDPGHEADVLDVERGDATPAHVPGWVERMRAKGRNPVVYTSRSELGQVEAACAAAKVSPPFYWVADWTGEAHLVSGSVATQWADGSEQYPGLARGADTSLVSPNFPPPFTGKQKGTGPVKLPFSKAQAMAVLRQAVAYVALAESITNRVHVPNSVRVALAGAATVLLGIEHYVQGSS